MTSHKTVGWTLLTSAPFIALVSSLWSERCISDIPRFQSGKVWLCSLHQPVVNWAHPYHRWHLHATPHVCFSKHRDAGMLNIQTVQGALHHLSSWITMTIWLAIRSPNLTQTSDSNAGLKIQELCATQKDVDKNPYAVRDAQARRWSNLKYSTCKHKL